MAQIEDYTLKTLLKKTGHLYFYDIHYNLLNILYNKRQSGQLDLPPKS